MAKEHIKRVKIPAHRPDPRQARPVDLDAFERRLRRLADETRRIDFSNGKVAFDFHIAQKAPSKAYNAHDVRQKQYRKDWQRNAGTSESVSVFKNEPIMLNDGREGCVYSLSEYCLRLDHPTTDDMTTAELRRAVAKLVEESVPPPNTEVSIRKQPKPFFAPGFPEYFMKPTPHIFSEEIDSHPRVLLDFIVDFMPEYRERFL